MHYARTPSLVPLLLVATIAPGCGPEDAGPSPHGLVCDEPSPERLLHAPEAASGWVVGRVGERVVVSIEDQHGRTSAYAVGLCGEDPVELELTDEVGLWGDGLFTYTGDLEYHDVHTGEHHRVFADVYPTSFSTPQGILALGRNGGPLLLHPDPTDPAAEPITLLPATLDLGISQFPNEELFSDGTHTYAIDPAGSLVRIELASGDQEPLIDDVVRFRVVDGGSQIVYISRTNGVRLRDLTTADEVELGPDAVVLDPSGYGYLYVSEAYDWLSVGYGQLVHLGRHEVLTTPGRYLYPAEDGRVILMRPEDPSQVEVTFTLPDLEFWLLDDDGSFELLAKTTCYEPPSYIDAFHPNGVAIDYSCSSDTAPGEPGDVVFYPIGGEPYVAGRNFGQAWLMSGHVLSIELETTFGGERPTGRLLIDSPDGPPAVVAYGVVALAAPTDDGDDLYYLVEGQGLYRATLDLE